MTTPVKPTHDLFPETLLVDVKDGHTFTTSLKVAEHFHKAHRNVIRDIEKLILELTELGIDTLNFERISYQDSMNRERVAYNMNRVAFSTLACRFTGTRVLPWQIQYHYAFEAMEAYIHAETARHASAFAQVKPKLVQIETGDQQGLSRAAIAVQTGHKCLGSITAGRARARALGLLVKPAKKGGAA